MTDLSPQARKATQAGEARRRAYWPKLERTTTGKLVLTHPHRGGRKHLADLAAYVEENLPALTWDGKRKWWWIPLSATNLEEILDAFTLANEVQLRLSEGVEEMKSDLSHNTPVA